MSEGKFGELTGELGVVSDPISERAPHAVDRDAGIDAVAGSAQCLLRERAAAFPVSKAGRLPHQHFQGLLSVHYSLQPVGSRDHLRDPLGRLLQN